MRAPPSPTAIPTRAPNIENAFDKRGELGRVTQCSSVDLCFSDYRVYPIKPMNFGVKFGEKF